MTRTCIFFLLSWMIVHVAANCHRPNGPYTILVEAIENLMENSATTIQHLRIGPSPDHRCKKIISGPVKFLRKVGPLGIFVKNYKRDGTTLQWVKDHEPMGFQNMCLLTRQYMQPFLDCFTAHVTNYCTIEKGEYFIHNFTIEPIIRKFTKGSSMHYQQCKVEAYVTEGPDFKPVFGYNLTFAVTDADQYEHQLSKSKRCPQPCC